MIDLINRIFEEENHVLIDTKDLKIFSLQGAHNYWIITNSDNIKSVLDEQIEIFTIAKKAINVPQFDKNANLLILHKVNTLVDIDKEALLQIEEDGFHFKKSVIYYTEEEFSKLIEAIGESKAIESIEIMLLKEDIFEQHKNNFDKNDYQSLLYRIAHKIPFINVSIEQVNNLESLEEINKEAIQQNDLNALLENEFFNLTGDDLKNMSDDTLLDKFKTILPNENQ